MNAQRQSDGWIFSQLSAKQCEVLTCLADGRTSKEIAVRLQISESAVNQRIESVRGRFNGLPRKEIVRRYRRWIEDTGPACNVLTGERIQVPDEAASDSHWPQEVEGATVELADILPFELRSPWQADEPKIVPEALDGPNAVIERVLAISKIAAGISIAMLTMLAVGNALSNMLS